MKNRRQLRHGRHIERILDEPPAEANRLRVLNNLDKYKTPEPEFGRGKFRRGVAQWEGQRMCAVTGG